MSSNFNDSQQETMSKNQGYSQRLRNQKLHPQSLQSIVLFLKQQLRQCKSQGQRLQQQHKEQISTHIKQISLLKGKLLQLRQKEYLRSVLDEQQDDDRLKLVQMSKTEKKLRMYVQKLQNDLRQKDSLIEKQKQEKSQLQREKSQLAKEKEKHLELSILEKISLEERITVLDQEMHSKDNLLDLMKTKSTQSTHQQLQLKQLQRQLHKKMQQLNKQQTQLNSYNIFQSHKLQQTITSLQKENSFLKNHLNTISQQSPSQCQCLNNDCKKQLNQFRHKYISKSRQLSKAKVELTKEIFKEQFLKDLKEKENTISDVQLNTKSKQFKKNTDYGRARMNKGRQKDQEENNDIMLFKLTELDQDEPCLSSAKYTSSTLPTYKSQMLTKTKSKALQYR